MKENIGHKNQRWHPRIAWTSDIKYRLPEKGLVWETSTICNVSLGGCAFDTELPYEVGEVLEIEIRSNILNGCVRFLGSIKRCLLNDAEDPKKYRVAIHFVEMMEDENNDFINMIQSLMKQSGIN